VLSEDQEFLGVINLVSDKFHEVCVQPKLMIILCLNINWSCNRHERWSHYWGFICPNLICIFLYGFLRKLRSD